MSTVPALLLVGTLAACAVPLRSLDPTRAIAEEERFELLRQGGFEVFTAPSIRREPAFLEATFVARELAGESAAARLTEFSVVTWIDTDRDGVQDPNERAREDRVIEPSGMRGAVLQVVTPYEPGFPVRFRLETTLDGIAVLREGELAY